MNIHTHRGRLRLPRAAYKDLRAIFSVTFCTQGRVKLFAGRELASAAVEKLVLHAARRNVTLHAHCVMPDHLHAVVTPSQELDVVDYVGQTKNLIQRRVWAGGGSGLIWQPRFWDRYVRRDEDNELMDHVRYVLDNPVRAGLVPRWEEYPFSGSVYVPRPAS